MTSKYAIKVQHEPFVPDEGDKCLAVQPVFVGIPPCVGIVHGLRRCFHYLFERCTFDGESRWGWEERFVDAFENEVLAQSISYDDEKDLAARLINSGDFVYLHGVDFEHAALQLRSDFGRELFKNAAHMLYGRPTPVRAIEAVARFGFLPEDLVPSEESLRLVCRRPECPSE